MPPVQVRAAGLAYVRSTRAWQLAENRRAPWKSAIFSGGWLRGASRSVKFGGEDADMAERHRDREGAVGLAPLLLRREALLWLLLLLFFAA